MKYLIVGSVACTLVIGENLLDKCIVIEGFNKNATLSGIRMGVKKRGNFSSVIFQRIAAADQLLLFSVVEVIFCFSSGFVIIGDVLQPIHRSGRFRQA